MKILPLLLCLLSASLSLANAQAPEKPAAPASATPQWTIDPTGASAQKLWPAHADELTHLIEKVKALHATGKKYDDQGKDRETVTKLLSEPLRQVPLKELKGDWRVRSLQGAMIGDTYGVYIYPWFKARFVTKKNGLFFEKTTGSQRRSGYLHAPDAPGTAWIFAGGWSVNDDPQVPYSRTTGATAPGEKDSYGLLLGLKDGRLLLIFDVTDSRYEIYELKK